MNDVETLHTNPELDALRQQLIFASPEGIDALRAEQTRAMNEAAVKAIVTSSYLEIAKRGTEIDKEARQEAAGHFEANLKEHLSTALDQDEQPELFGKFLNHLKKYSADRMSHTEWTLGEADEDGDYGNVNSQGYVRAQKDFEELCEELLAARGTGPEPVPGEPEPFSPEAQAELEEAQTQLDEARTKLARLSIHRRQMIRKGSKKAKGLSEEFETAEAAYKAAFIRLGTLKARQELALGKSGEALRASVVHNTLDEHQAFTAAEATVLDQDDSRRARFYRFLARKHNLLFASAASGFIAGSLSRKFIGGLGATIGISAVPVVLAAGAALKSTNAVLTATIGRRVNQIRMLDMRATADRLHLQDEDLPALTHDIDIETLVQAGDSALRRRIAERIEADRKYNRNRIIQAAVVSGAMAAAAGVVVADHFFSSHGAAPHTGGTEHHSTTTPPPHQTTPPPPPPPPHVTPPPTSPPPVHTPAPGTVDGYNTHVFVEHGHGYTNELQDLVAQKGGHLSGRQAWLAYLAMVHHFPNLHGNFFTNDPSYLRAAGDYGISHPGDAHWNPAVVDYFNKWFQSHVASS